MYKNHRLTAYAEARYASKAMTGDQNFQHGCTATPDFDIVWFDLPVREELLSKLKAHQRISQYPGIQALTSKARLARNLMDMQ